jgi:hypothetical protein
MNAAQYKGSGYFFFNSCRANRSLFGPECLIQLLDKRHAACEALFGVFGQSAVEHLLISFVLESEIRYSFQHTGQVENSPAARNDKPLIKN